MGRRILVSGIFLGTLALGFFSRAELPPRPRLQASSQSHDPDSLRAGGDAAEIPAQFIDNLISLPVQVNGGKPSLFQLDSSASATSIDPARASA